MTNSEYKILTKLMTNSEWKLMDHLEQAHDALIAAAKIAHIDKQPEAAIISSQIDTLEELISDAWQRFRLEANTKQ